MPPHEAFIICQRDVPHIIVDMVHWWHGGHNCKPWTCVDIRVLHGVVMEKLLQFSAGFSTGVGMSRSHSTAEMGLPCMGIQW